MLCMKSIAIWYGLESKSDRIQAKGNRKRAEARTKGRQRNGKLQKWRGRSRFEEWFSITSTKLCKRSLRYLSKVALSRTNEEAGEMAVHQVVL